MSKTKELSPNDINKYATTLSWRNFYKQPDTADAQIAPKEYLDSLLEAAAKWAEANPGQDIFIHYDSELCGKGASTNTQNLINDKYTIYKDQIKLRDIRDITFVKNNPGVFATNVDDYSVIDFLKLVEILDLLLQGYDAVAFADISVGGLRPDGKQMGKEELYSQDILDKLYKTGIVTNIAKDINEYGEEIPYRQENQFIQAVNNPATLIALKANIETCANVIKNILNESVQLGIEQAKKNLGIYVFSHCTLRNVTKYYQTHKNGDLLIKANVVGEKGEGYVLYDYSRDNLDLRGTEFNLRAEALYNNEGIWVNRYIQFNCDDKNPKAEARFTDTRSGNHHPSNFGYLGGCSEITQWMDGFQNTTDPILQAIYEGKEIISSAQDEVTIIGTEASQFNAESFNIDM